MSIGTPPQYVYTSRDEMEGVLSQTGINLRIDDIDVMDSEGVLDSFFYDATLVIDTYTQHLYYSQDLYSSYWVRIRASWLACYYLSQRRGNPALFQVRYNQILEELERIMDGELLIPGLPTAYDITPAMSNVVVDERFAIDKIRVHPSISTGGTSSRQSLSPRFPFDWL